ncbi:MAG: helix-turn-helix transcriptional regulator [Syntrophorhabdaceae bacterium]|nr:helix-turn-helix transcriptional regulator [Syntrophorhabdaceae bacterium]
MKWEGSKLKELARDKRLSLQALAAGVGVSRQTINDWVKGQVPKGNHLLLLCKLLGTSPNTLFSGEAHNDISVPIHRQRMNSKIAESTQKAAFEFSKEYLSVFRNNRNSEILPVVRSQDGKSVDDARQIAEKLRLLSGIPEGKPFDYKHTFKLSQVLGIYVIFRDFPAPIKSYAFYIRIHGHRVVFVNNSTNIIDLIFPLLHESVHAVRDEIDAEGGYDEEEEAFCDLVAGFIQFPPSYVNQVYSTIERLPKAQQVNILKGFARANGHSLYGIVKAIKVSRPRFELKVGGADANLRKEFPTIGKKIFAGDDPGNFLRVMAVLSKNFLGIISDQLESISDRKMAELFGMEGGLDGKEIKAELSRVSLSSQG